MRTAPSTLRCAPLFLLSAVILVTDAASAAGGLAARLAGARLAVAQAPEVGQQAVELPAGSQSEPEIASAGPITAPLESAGPVDSHPEGQKAIAANAQVPASEPSARANAAYGQGHEGTKKSTRDALFDHLSMDLLWYLAYGGGQKDGESFNQARINRGYVTFKLKPVKWFAPRVTFDTHQDDSGDWKVRLKYMYGKLILPVETRLVSEPNIEFGLVHTPWFDFEEHVNNYRMQGTMFIERNGLLNSADAGITVGGLLGKKLPKDYQKRVSKKYPGTYGSFAFGAYNGGGYHAQEKNESKVMMARLSARPLGLILPGLQISYLLIYGKGNTDTEPDWQLHDVMASFEHEYFAVTAQAAKGKGNQKGTYVDSDGDALEHYGYSGFAELKMPDWHSSIIARYDFFDMDGDGSGSGVGLPRTRMIFGYAYHILGKSILMVDYDRLSYSSRLPTDWQVQATLQVHY